MAKPDQRGRLSNWYTASELVALDTAHSDECAVLILRPSSYAVLCQLVEFLDYSSLIVDDISSSPTDRAFDIFMRRMRTDMGYTYGLTEYLERIADAQEDVASALRVMRDESGDGVADVLYDLALAMAASGAQPQEQSASVTAAMSCCAPERVQDGISSGLIRKKGAGSLCYDLGEASPLTNPEIDAVLVDLGGGLWGVSPESGATRQRFDLSNVVPGVYDVSLGIEFYDGAGLANPTLRDGGTIIEDFGFVGDGVYTATWTIGENSEPQLFIQNPQGYGYDLSLQMCVSSGGSVDASTPVLAMHLNGGVGKKVGGNLFRTAEGWFANGWLVDPVIVELELDDVDDYTLLYDGFFIDWTRPTEASMTIQMLDDSVHVDTIVVDTTGDSTQDRIIVPEGTSPFNRVILQIVSPVVQKFADILVYAFKFNAD